jgi:hypothetical protein
MPAAPADLVLAARASGVSDERVLAAIAATPRTEAGTEPRLFIGECRRGGQLRSRGRSGTRQSRGGHSAPGFGTTDGGMQVDRALIRHVHVDPSARTAPVGGGATWG